MSQSRKLFPVLCIIFAFFEAPRNSNLQYYAIKCFHMEQRADEAWGNLRFLMSLHIKNSIFNPKLPIMLFSDSSMIEVAAIISQWNPQLMDFQLLTCKSILFSQSLRNHLNCTLSR